MRLMTMLIMILLFWFSLSFILSLASADTSLYEIGRSFSGNESYAIDKDTSSINWTSSETASSSPISIASMVLRIFTFRIPNFIVPTSINVILTFMNWLLLVIFSILVYRLLSPSSAS